MSLPKKYGLGSLSDCFARCPDTNAEVTDQLIVYKTKSRLDYWFGNYLVSNSPVTLESLPQIRSQWLENFAQEKGILWQIVEWEIPFDGVMPDVSKIAEAASAEVDVTMVRLAKRSDFQFHVSSDALESDVELIQVNTEDQAKSALKIALADLEASPETGVTADFIEWQFDQRLKAANLGQGNWWLLLYQGLPVSSCGLFFNQDGSMGRYREVITHPNWRGRGFATKLCGMLAQHCFEQSQVQELIIVSEPDSTADKIYSKLGFNAVSCQIALKAETTSSLLG